MHRFVPALLVAAGVAAAAPQPPGTFSVDEAAGFRPVPEALAAYLAERAVRAGTHHFCIVGYRRADAAEADRLAWVYWHEGQRLIRWEPAADGFESKETLLRSRRDLDLREDVVATESDLAGSTYRVDRPWLRRLLADCRERGQRFTIRRP